MRLMLLAALALALAFPAPKVLAASDGAEAKEARVGQPLILKFPGNREAGYRWRLNEEKSSGLDLVEVDQVAWTIPNDNESRSIFFSSPSVLSFRVVPKAAGEADLAFDYFRTWGNKPYVRTQNVRVTISP